MIRVGPALLIMGAALSWSLLGPVSRVAFEAGISPLEVAFWRAALVSILFGGHAIIARAGLPSRRDLPAFGLFALIGGSLFFASYQFAVESGGAALAAVLLYTAPAWVIVAAALMFGERITPRRIIALGLTLGGVAVIAFQGGAAEVTVRSILWGLTAGISYASYFLFGKKYFSRYRPELVYAIIFPIAAITLFPLTAFAAKSVEAWIAIGTVTFVSTYVAYVLYGAGLKRMEAGRASLIATIEPVSATFIAYLWWGERFSALGYVGAALVLSAVILVIMAAPARPDRGSLSRVADSPALDHPGGRGPR